MTARPRTSAAGSAAGPGQPHAAGSAAGARRRRNPLSRRFPRELRNNPGKYLGLFLMMAFAVSFTSGFLMSARSIEQLCLEMDERYAVEDAYVTVDFEAGKGAVEAAEALGATLVPTFYHEPALLVPDDSRQLTARLYAPRTQVDLPAYAAGRAPDGPDEVALDRVFAANHGLQLGDTVQLAGRNVTVSGIVTLPDYQALFQDNASFMFNAVTFCVGLVSQDGYAALADTPETFRYAIVLDDPTLDLAGRTSVEEDVIKALVAHGATVSDFADAADNQGIGYALDDVQGDSVMWTVLLLILVVIMAFVFVVLTGATIEAESSVIGTLLASGWRRGELLRHYATLPAAIGAAACAVGLALGLTLLAEPFQGLYYNSYSLPPFEMRWSWDVVIVTTVLPYVLLMGITLAGLARRLRCTPLQFLRHELSTRRRRHTLRLPTALPYATRFRLRVLLRNASHFATMFAGIMFASLLMLFGTCMMPIMHTFAETMADDMPCAYEYVLKAPVELAGSASQRAAYAAAASLATSDDPLSGAGEPGFLSGLLLAASIDEDAHVVNSTDNGQAAIGQAEKFARTSVEVERAMFGKFETVSVYGILPGTRYWTDLGIANGAPVASQGLLQKTKAALGEPLELHDRHAGKTYAVVPARAGSSEVDVSLYLSLDDFNALFGNDADWFNAYASDLPLSIDERYLATTVTPDDMMKVAEQMEDSMGSIVAMMLYMAIPIYLILVYLLTKTVIDRSARPISYLKVFGYRNREVDGLYVQPITYAVVFSLVASLPLVYWGIVALVRVMFMFYSGNFPIDVAPWQFAQIVGIGLAAYALVAWTHVRRVRRVPLQVAMKVQE